MAEYLLVANMKEAKMGHRNDLHEINSFESGSDQQAENEGLKRLDLFKAKKTKIRKNSGIDKFCNFRVVKVIKTLR